MTSQAIETSLAVSPMQWGQLDDLAEVAVLDDTDLACMSAVRDVLLKFGKVDRFALHLIHKNFDLGDDEILVEYSNPSTKEQCYRAEKWDSEQAQAAIPTTWILKDMEPRAIGCARGALSIV